MILTVQQIVQFATDRFEYMNKNSEKIDMAALRDKLATQQGKQYWRSLEDLAGTEAFQKLVENEFSTSLDEFGEGFSRRRFLQVMGASLALAGLSACTSQPEEKIVPYVTNPEEIVPGKPLYYATAVMLGGYAAGVLAESHMGRPTKLEGNPEHPASLGATDIYAQASVLGLYDPDRSQVIRRVGRFDTWENYLASVQAELQGQRIKDGAGIRILTETVTAPALANQIRNILKDYPLARWHQYEPASRDSFKAGAQMAFGQYVDCQYHFEHADVVLSLDGDFFTGIPGGLVYARKFTGRRKAEGDSAAMNRLYAVESSPSLVGAMADHRLAMRAGDVAGFAASVAAGLGIDVPGVRNQAVRQKWIDALVRDLRKHSGRCVVVPGEYQTPDVHYLAHAINAALGNVGKTVTYTQSAEANPVVQLDSLRELVGDMESGDVDLLFILGGNPVYTAPAEFKFDEKMAKVHTRVHLSLYEDETSELCHWHIPQSHTLESWGDARAYDGTATIIQPLIAPLYGSKTAHDVLSVLSGQSGKSTYDIVKDYWKKEIGGVDFDERWQIALHNGTVAGTAFVRKTVRLQRAQNLNVEGSSPGIEVVFRPDPNIWDGRFANNGWLQELPKPLSKLTWDNAAMVSPATAARLDLENEQIVEISSGAQTVKAPVWIVPGHAEDCVTLYLGYGRTRVGHVGNGTGFSAYGLKPGSGDWFVAGVKINRIEAHWPIANTQEHGSMEGRNLVRSASVGEYESHPEMFHEMGHEPGPEMSLYPPFEYNGYAWGMAVDLNACIGCNACTIACQSENNIAVVGKEEVRRGREMHWIRIDRYYEGELDNPEVHHQPVMCMHCENAPCEVVCPVAATTHSDEGLNEMTYNRCVGTRYCANNCPYKVRRFNFFKYADYETESLKLMRNPDVTVRFRGVMEKCSYCVQRINLARIDAKKEDREIRDGEIVTACQQVCPADAIVFGNINDENSEVSRRKSEHRDYGLLAELGVRPRTSYLAKLKNPNPEIVES